MGFAPTFYFGKNWFVRSDNLVDKVREFAEKATGGSAIELVHVEIGALKNKRVVRIFIDKEGGVTHDDCSFVSHEIEDQLDLEDPVSSEYLLEVSSPGIERGLYRIEDFERFEGNEARLKTHDAIDGQRNFRGQIAGVNGDLIELEDITGGKVRIRFDQIKKANLTFDIEKELKESSRKKRKDRGR